MLVYDLYIPLLFLDFNFDAHNVCAIESLGFDKSKIKHEFDLEFWWIFWWTCAELLPVSICVQVVSGQVHMSLGVDEAFTLTDHSNVCVQVVSGRHKCP